MRRAAVLLLLGLVCASVLPGRESFDPERVLWSRLHYQASKFFITLNAEVEIETVGAAAVREALVEPPEDDTLPPVEAGAVKVEIDSRLLGRENQLDLWVVPGSGATLQRSEVQRARRFERNHLRTYRYGLRGVHSFSSKPATAAEVELPATDWTDRDSSFDPFSLVMEPPLTVTEPSALFYLLSVADLSSRGDTLQVPIYFKGRIFSVAVSVASRTRIEADFVRQNGGDEERVSGDVDAIELSLRSRTIEHGEQVPELELLGLRGDISIYLDPELRVPIELRGDLRIVGRGRIRLQRVELR